MRWFVYGVLVQCPTLHLEPGVVAAYSAPTVGILDVGRYPSGDSELSESIAREWQAARYSSQSVNDIARWKYAKLITNLGNAVEAVCGPGARRGPLTDPLQHEARAVLDHHAIDYASAAEGKQRRADLLQLHDIDGPRPGGSLWQNATRRSFLPGLLVEGVLDALDGTLGLRGMFLPQRAHESFRRLVVRGRALPSAAGSGPLANLY